MITNGRSVADHRVDTSGILYLKNDRATCTGVLVAERILATASHCFSSGLSNAAALVGAFWNGKSVIYADRFRVDSRFPVEGRDIAFMVLKNSDRDGDTPSGSGLNITPMTGLTDNALGIPDMVTIMGYSGHPAHKDGSSYDLESCANVPLDQGGLLSADLAQAKGFCWDYKEVKQEDGAVERVRITGSVIQKGASGGPWFFYDKDRERVSLYAVHMGANNKGSVITVKAKKAFDAAVEQAKKLD
ncbi:trypsin-like serine peptidase [Streptomyces wuyuanensis]|uniref:trypsin-like serine peptidase n=1 Tax=Streptomyces wuyuanensis TaxID=1196353 RepID=UPI00341794F9